VQPYVALGVGLQRAGHAVRLATHPRFCGEVRERGLEPAPIAEGALSHGQATSAGRAWVRWGDRVLPHWVGMLKDASSVAEQRLVNGWNASADADVIVVSVLATLLGRQLAVAQQVPLVRAYYAPPGRMARPAMRQAVWLCSRPWINRARRAALGLPGLGLREPFRALDEERVPLLYGYSPVVAPPGDDSRADWVDVTGYWLLDVPGDWTPDPALAAFLDAGDPPVLVSFGAMADRHPERSTALLLEALSRAECRAILIRGPHLAPDTALPTGVIAVDSVPYDWLFPRLAAAVHHGGAGTTAYALRAGVPSVVVPAIADQPFWAERVHALGVGPQPIPRRELSAARLAEAIRLATTDAAIRQRAVALAGRVAAEDGVRVAVDRFEHHLSGRTGRADGERIATRARPECPACGTRGVPRHRGLRDRLYAAPGSWAMAQCPQPACRMLWLDPVPTEQDLAKAYRTYYTHAGEPPPRARPFLGLLASVRRAYLRGARPATGLIRVLPGGRDAMDDTAGHLPAPRPGARLLEVGFGSGDQLVRMRELGWDVTGVDVDPVVVDAARRRGLDAHAGELSALRLPEGQFDAVYLSHVIEHVHEPIDLLRECRRVLRPGGTLVVITPNADSHGHRRFGAAWFGLDPPRHLVVFSPDGLSAAARQAGFADASVRSSARIAFITWIAGEDIRRGGRVVSFDGAVPLGRLARGVTAQVAEAARLAIRPDAGEELLLRATKPPPGASPDATSDRSEEMPWDSVSPSLV